jgi:hypothetical protein
MLEVDEKNQLSFSGWKEINVGGNNSSSDNKASGSGSGSDSKRSFSKKSSLNINILGKGPSKGVLR